MKHIGAVQSAVTRDEFDGGPTAAELDAIEVEMPVILADIELLDAQIATLDRVPTPLDARRLRRARRRALAARVDLVNQAVAVAGVSA
ncbi:DUF6284 family protein [Streptomyces acidiscabies]|uniref:DUF6284 family protein n=1 Tax=Streptomyces acidiscabies TaxID=42234 RepID=UPI0030CB59ED